jgi:hypothetical protein
MSFRASNYRPPQWLAPVPCEPGAKVGLLPGTMPALCDVDSSTTPSSREAQAEIKKVIANSKTAHDAERGIIGTNLTSDTFDARRGVR